MTTPDLKTRLKGCCPKCDIQLEDDKPPVPCEHCPCHNQKSVEEIAEEDMTDFERNLAQAILGALEYRGFYDCGKYLDTLFIERIRPLLAQRERAVRERDAVEVWKKHIKKLTNTKKL